MRTVTRVSGLAVALAVLAAAGCASGGAAAPKGKPGDKTTAAAKPGDKAAAAKPGTTPAKPGATPAKPGTAPAKPGTAPAKPGTTPAKPAETKPAAKPAETKPAAKPAETKPAPKPAETKPAPKPAETKPGTKPAETKPGAKPAETKPGAKPAETKPGTKPAETKPAAKPAPKPAPKPSPKPADTKAEAGAGAAAGAGGASSMDRFMERTGKKFEDMKFLGMRFRPYFHEEIGYTDNVFYQDDDEEIVVDLFGLKDPKGGLVPLNTLDGNLLPASPGPIEPEGKVSDVFSNMKIGFEMEMPLNTALVPLLEEGMNNVKVFGASLNWVEYLTEDVSPDALNFEAHTDLISEFVKDLLKMQTSRSTWYARFEGNYSRVTDPLDVPKLHYQGVNPTLSFAGSRNDFTRTEWFGKASLGWKGPRFDAMGSVRLYSFAVDDDTLDSADHTETQFHGEIGWTRKNTDHRYYGHGTLTRYDFPARGPDEDVQGLRNFDVWKAGLGWEGPFLTKKLRGNVEGYYLGMDMEDSTPPSRVNPDGSPDYFNRFHGVGAKVLATYRPFVTKATAFQVEYHRDLEWSVVADYKIVDSGYVSLSHPINERLSSNLKYSVTHENVAEREKRLYQEVGLGLRYRLWAYTHLTFQYTLRAMNSKNEQVTAFSDAGGEIFNVQANGDFIANVVSLGINVDF